MDNVDLCENAVTSSVVVFPRFSTPKLLNS
jgi:hypothetical protein